MHRLLLVDDSPTMHRIVELSFAREDVQVIAVRDGEQAMRALASSRPDIVLADHAAAGRDGYELASFVREQPDLADVPVLLIGGAFEPVDQDRAARSGIDGVLVKPVEPMKLVERVRALIDERARAPQRTPASVPTDALRSEVSAGWFQREGVSGAAPVEPSFEADSFAGSEQASRKPSERGRTTAAPPQAALLPETPHSGRAHSETPLAETPLSPPLPAAPDAGPQAGAHQESGFSRALDGAASSAAAVPGPAMPVGASEGVQVPAAASEAAVAVAAPPAPRRPSGNDGLDDYFERLDAALGTLGASRDGSGDDRPLTAETLSRLMAVLSPQPPPAPEPQELPTVQGLLAAPASSGVAGAAPDEMATLTSDSEAEEAETAYHHDAVAEQDDAMDVRLVDQIASRVVARLSRQTVERLVRDVIVEVAERLVRDELARDDANRR